MSEISENDEKLIYRCTYKLHQNLTYKSRLQSWYNEVILEILRVLNFYVRTYIELGLELCLVDEYSRKCSLERVCQK